MRGVKRALTGDLFQSDLPARTGLVVDRGTRLMRMSRRRVYTVSDIVLVPSWSLGFCWGTMTASRAPTGGLGFAATAEKMPEESSRVDGGHALCTEQKSLTADVAGG